MDYQLYAEMFANVLYNHTQPGSRKADGTVVLNKETVESLWSLVKGYDNARIADAAGR